MDKLRSLDVSRLNSTWYWLAMIYGKLERTQDADREWSDFQQLTKLLGRLRKVLQQAFPYSQALRDLAHGP
jgi:hypothetical protein